MIYGLRFTIYDLSIMLVRLPSQQIFTFTYSRIHVFTYSRIHVFTYSYNSAPSIFGVLSGHSGGSVVSEYCSLYVCIMQ